MRRAVLLTLALAYTGLVLAGCTDETADPAGPLQAETGTLDGKPPPAGCLSTDQQALADAIRAAIEDLFVGRGGQRSANVHLNNITRKLCEEDYDDALAKAWGFLGLVREKIPDEFSGDAADASALVNLMFALVAADPNPAPVSPDIPPGVFQPGSSVVTFDPSEASESDPIIIPVQDQVGAEDVAALVVDDPDVFPPGTDDVTVAIYRAPDDVVTADQTFIPGFDAFPVGVEILSSEQPWDQGPGILIALCALDGDVIGHNHDGGIELLLPTDPDPETLGYVDCQDVDPFFGSGEEPALSFRESEDRGSMRLARSLVEPVLRWFSPSPLNAELLVVGRGLGGRTRSLSLDAPVDATINVGESAQLSVGTEASWSSDDTNVATVDQDGLLTGVAPGTATITADFDGESLEMTITVEGGVGGNLIAFASGRDGDVEVYVMATDGSGQTNITNDPDATDNAPTWSPDGSRIAFSSNVSEVDRIYTMNPDGSGRVGPLGTGSPAVWPSWSPDGTKIAYSDGARIHVMNADGTNDVTVAVALPGVLDWAPDGTRFVVDSSGDIVLVNTDGTGSPTTLTSGFLDTDPQWSPDGTKIVFTREDPEVTPPEIYVMDADGTNLLNLTNNPADDRQPHWSPDGSQILFWSDRSQAVLVFVMNADGSSPTALTSAGPDFDPEWQPQAPPPVIE